MAAPTTRARVQPVAKPRNDAYTGLLFISFLALVISSILLFLDYNQYGTTNPPKPNLAQPGTSSPPFIGDGGAAAGAGGAAGAGEGAPK